MHSFPAVLTFSIRLVDAQHLQEYIQLCQPVTPQCSQTSRASEELHTGCHQKATQILILNYLTHTHTQPFYSPLTYTLLISEWPSWIQTLWGHYASIYPTYNHKCKNNPDSRCSINASFQLSSQKYDKRIFNSEVYDKSMILMKS